MSSKNQFLLVLFVLSALFAIFNPVLTLLGALLTACVAVFALGHSAQDPSEMLRGATVASREYLMKIHLRKLFRATMYPTLRQQLTGRGLRPNQLESLTIDHSEVFKICR